MPEDFYKKATEELKAGHLKAAIGYARMLAEMGDIESVRKAADLAYYVAREEKEEAGIKRVALDIADMAADQRQYAKAKDIAMVLGDNEKVTEYSRRKLEEMRKPIHATFPVKRKKAANA